MLILIILRFGIQKASEKFFLNIQLTNKQKISLGVLMLSVGYISVFAQFTPPPPINSQGFYDILNGVSGSPATYAFFGTSFGWLEIVKNIINYIIEAQTSSTQTIAAAKFGNSSMFSRINNAVTIFAVIACGYKILIHYLKTERFDNVQAFTGFFSYFGILRTLFFC